MLSEAVVVALISGVAGLAGGVYGKSRYDQTRSPSDGTIGQPHIEAIITRRAELEFQTRMTILMDNLTSAIEKGHEKASGQLALVSEAITEAADSVRELHQQIIKHREATAPAVHAVLQTHQLVLDLHRRGHPDESAHH